MLKVFLIGIGLVVALVTLSGVAVAAYLVTGGFGSVEVHTPDVDLSLSVPTRIIDLGLGVASVVAPRDELRKLRDEIGVANWQAIDGLARELTRCADGELVRVRTETEWVSVSKRGGRLLVEVDAPDVQVEVALPERAVSRIVRQVAALAGPGIALPVF